MNSSALTVALALVTGIVAQALARHLRLPGIVLLLAAGVLLGPDGAGVIRPALLGDGLMVLVSFAVAVILFEGGLSLNLGQLRREQRAIRQLVTVGALVTLAGGTLAARLILGWDWRLSFLFGALVIVTGPTVVNPLLRRLNVTPTVATVLAAEGVFIDAIGAILAVAGLEVALQPSGETLARGALHLVASLGLGAGIGIAFGLALSAILRFRRLIPEGLENVLALSLVLAVFHVSDAIAEESGIAAVIFAGILTGNTRSPLTRELAGFKEQLTSLLIGLLFVLLAADVRLENVRALGLPGALIVLTMILVVRPLNVIAGTAGTTLGWRERAFMAWIGPRGIVAAAVASFFAVELEAAGIEGGRSLRALVFLLIAATVLTAGLTGPLLASLLKLRKPQNAGWVILGLGELGRTLAKLLQDTGEEVVGVDTNPQSCRAASEEGLKVVHGNALEELVLQRLEVSTRKGVIGLTPNDEVNLLFVRGARAEGHPPTLLGAAGRSNLKTAQRLLEEEGGALLFGQAVDVDLWSVRLRRGITRVEWFRATRTGAAPRDAEGLFLPLVTSHAGSTRPFTEAPPLRQGDQVALLVNVERLADAIRALQEQGLEALVPPGAEVTEQRS